MCHFLILVWHLKCQLDIPACRFFIFFILSCSAFSPCPVRNAEASPSTSSSNIYIWVGRLLKDSLTKMALLSCLAKSQILFTSQVKTTKLNQILNRFGLGLKNSKKRRIKPKKSPMVTSESLINTNLLLDKNNFQICFNQSLTSILQKFSLIAHEKILISSLVV